MNSNSSLKIARAQLSQSEKVGQLFMPAAFINDTEQEIQQIENLISKEGVGGLCFFHSRASAATNFEGKKKVVHNAKSFDTLQNLIQRYQRAAKYPLLIAIDAEWGLAMRIENTPQYPYAITLGAIQNNCDLVFEVGRNIALDCKMAGIHWNLAPVVDLNNNPNNPVIGYRSFGEDKDQVTDKALAFIKGTQSEGILTSIKHFPGHGDTATDSHLGLPLISKSKEELAQNELYPFQKLIDEGVDSVMVGHLSVPALAEGKMTPSSISKTIIKEILRKEMGYNGVVISDALNMHAISKDYPVKGELEWLAFEAGNDVLCFSENCSEGIQAILKNASEKQIEESFQRIWKLKEKTIQIQGLQSSMALTNADELNLKIAHKSLTLFKGTEEALAKFSTTSFAGLENTQPIENHFFNYLSENKKFNRFYSTETNTNSEENILLALFPQQVKPAHNFGFTDEEITAINTLFSTKNVVLYLFGNPYLLNLFDTEKAEGIIIVYQNFKTFQKVAAAHFLGEFDAVGKLPVHL
ncbi:glycoside hydrolase family 3 protein [uncultured Kriegella sp.]|uniref:glycoside hydrolase family 3 protein n=1 Tax=uncultured Kriegella sp. TaxID=1798910 RepID=UPI0030D84319|tara:strand:+ start:233492 stop:235066 length:1575 start_codon:yes stop_codon:yes gene_type:complete